MVYIYKYLIYGVMSSIEYTQEINNIEKQNMEQNSNSSYLIITLLIRKHRKQY